MGEETLIETPEGVTVTIPEADPPGTPEPEGDALAAALTAQALHDAARAEVHAEQAREDAHEALDRTDRSDEQWRLMEERLTSLSNELGSIREQLSAMPPLIPLVTEEPNTLEATETTISEAATDPEILAETAEMTGESLETTTDILTEASNATKTDHLEGSADAEEASTEHPETHRRPRVLLY